MYLLLLDKCCSCRYCTGRPTTTRDRGGQETQMAQTHDTPDCNAQPGHWPFPRLESLQARRHAECVESLRRLEARRRQERLRECLESFNATFGEARL